MFAALLLSPVLPAGVWSQAAAETLIAARVWPAPDYTRLTFEARRELRFQVFSVKDPERLVLDIEGVEIGPQLSELQNRITAADPYIAKLRVARNRPGVVRVVLDLKTEVKSQVFSLKPVGEYSHRLVLDLYPLVPPDPLAALLEPRPAAPPPARSTTQEVPKAPLPAPQSPSAAAQPSPSPAAAAAPAGTVPPAAPRLPPAATVVKASPSPARMARFATIVIDPGHGGEDPGALGPNGTREKDITLTIARRLKELIDEEPDLRAVLTRDGDFYIPLPGRVEKARRLKADLLVSIHADAFIKPRARGSSVFALSERRATSEAARWLAKKENEADLIGGVNLDVKDRYLAQTLLDLSQTATIDHSLRLGNAVLAQLGQVNTLHKRRVEQASFAVLKAPDIPSILVETAFISNPEEEARLRDESYQMELARAVLKGIKAYLQKHPPRPQSTVASK